MEYVGDYRLEPPDDPAVNRVWCYECRRWVLVPDEPLPEWAVDECPYCGEVV
jgi:hypothetical protein